MDVQINTYWNVDTLYQVLNGVSAVMGSGDYVALIKMIMMLGLMLGITLYALTRNFNFFGWLLNGLIWVSILNLPIAKVVIVDKTNLEAPKVVQNVPWVLALGAATVTNVTGWFTSTYETVFTLPNSLGIEHGDMAFGHQILKQTNKVEIQNPELKSDLIQFFKECTLYDVSDGAISAKDLVAGTDSWNLIFNNTSPARFVTYNTLSGSPVTATCKATAAVLKQRVNDGISRSQQIYGRKMFPRTSTDTVAASLFASTVATSYDWILSSNASASDAMKQSMFNAMWREAGTQIPTMLNDTASIQASTLMGVGLAAQQAKGSQSVVTYLAQEAIPHTRNWLEAIALALFPVIVIMMIMVQVQSAIRILTAYFSTFVFLGMIPLIFAIINHLSLLNLSRKLKALQISDTIPFQLSDAYDATISDEQTAIGYLVIIAVPLAAWLASKLQGSLSTAMSSMYGAYSAAGATAGASTASGNASIGQQSVDTANMNTTTMNKTNADVETYSGAFISRDAYGNTLTNTGKYTAQRHLSNSLPYSMHGSTSYSGGQNSESTRGTDASTGDEKRFGNTTSAGFGSNAETGRGERKNQNIGQRRSDGEESGDQRRFNNTVTDGKEVSKGGNYTESSRFTEDYTLRGAIPITGGSGSGRTGSPPGAQVSSTPGSNGNGGTSGNGKGAKSGKGGKGGKLGGLLNADATYTGQKSYSVDQNTNLADREHYSQTEGVSQDINYNKNSSNAVEQSKGRETDQTQRIGNSANLQANLESGQSTQASSSKNVGHQDRAFKGEEKRLELGEDLLTPGNVKKVANSLGMSDTKFITRFTDAQQQAMLGQYFADKGAIDNVQKMANNFMDGSKAPNAKSVQQRGESWLNSVPGNSTVLDQHKQNKAALGINEAGMAPLPVNVNRSAQTEAAENFVNGKKPEIAERNRGLRDKTDWKANPDEINTNLMQSERTADLMERDLKSGAKTLLHNQFGIGSDPQIQPHRPARIYGSTQSSYGKLHNDAEDVAKQYNWNPREFAGLMYAESSFNAKAKPKDKDGNLLSSATGVGQFIESTWLNVGSKSNNPEIKAAFKNAGTRDAKLALRENPRLSMLMTAELAEMGRGKVETALKQNKMSTRDIDALDLYATHNLGEDKGAQMAVARRNGSTVAGIVNDTDMKNNPYYFPQGKNTQASTYYDRVKTRFMDGMYYYDQHTKNKG